MQKPEGFERALQSFEQPKLGGHRLEIIKVDETQSKTGKDMIKIIFDFAKDDTQPEYFQKMYDKDTREKKKWSIQGTKFILVYDSKGNTSREFRLFCDAVSASNSSFNIQWGDNWGLQFSRKSIGGIFGEEMDYYNGKEIKKTILRKFVPVEEAEGAKIPEMTESKAYTEYMENHIDADDSLPF
jgi:hypothetical protein